MGCSVWKLKDDCITQSNPEASLKKQNKQQQQQSIQGDQVDLSIYDKVLKRNIKIPKLGLPIYNKIVQRRQIQQKKEQVQQNIEMQ